MKKVKVGIYDLTGCSSLGYKGRIAVYKSLGIKELALYLDNSYMEPGENYLEIIKYAREQGVKINQVHVDYKISNMICDKKTNDYFNYIDQKANECDSLKIPYLVLHASKGDNPPIIDEEQLNKLKNVTKKYLNVNFCFENVRNNTNLEKILSLNEPNIKMCYDIGHAHAYGDELQIFNKFKTKIVCSHLHNNNGKDDHKILKDGEINYKPIIHKLVNIKNVSNCLESFPKDEKLLTQKEFEDYVKISLDF